MTREFNVVVAKDADGYFVASNPSIRLCHTQAKSLDQLMQRIEVAIQLCLEVKGAEVEPLAFVGNQRVSVEA